MLKIGNLVLGKNPKIVAAVSDTVPVSLLKKAKSLGVDIIETRIDLFKRLDPDYVAARMRKIKAVGIPVIATIRHKKEGGGKNIDEKTRLELFKKIMPLADAVDIELFSKNIISEIIKLARQNKKTVIVSCHNFKNTPPDKMLINIIKSAKNKKADIVKIAAKPKNKDDIFRLLALTKRYKNQNLITMSLGELGAISRIIFPFFGSLLTYSYINKPAAPGQLPIKILTDFRKFVPDTGE